MSVQRISSFKTFTEIKNQQNSVKMHEENKAKREQILSSIGAALEELGVTSLQELDEEKRNNLIAKIFNEDRAKDIEAAKVKMGQPKQLEAGEDEESEEVEEGNKFIYAAAKAKADGKTEFEFNGKKYKVTLKSDTGVKESLMIITEGTRGFFGKIDKSGKIAAVYTHYDSYPSHMLPLIKKSYKNSKNVDAVLAKGDNSGLEDDINKMNFYGGKNSEPLKGDVNNIRKFLRDTEGSGAEFVYLYDERDNKWYMSDLEKNNKEIVPAFESLEIEEDDLNENSKLSMREEQMAGEISQVIFSYKKLNKQEKLNALNSLIARVEGDDLNKNYSKLSMREEQMAGEISQVIFSYKKLNKQEKLNALNSLIARIEGGDLNEARSINKIQGEWSKVTAAMAEKAKEYKSSEGDAKSKVLDELKSLTAKKKALEAELDAVVADKDKDLELVVSESAEVNEDIDIHDKLSDLMNKLQVQIGNLLHVAKGDSAWTKELSTINKAFETLEDRISIASKKLGMIPESVVNEADIKSDDEFAEYATTLLKKAFGDEYDEAKAKEVIDGILSKADGDYGNAVGMLQSSLD